MKKNCITQRIVGLFLLLFCSLTVSAANYPAGSPVAINGKLKVSGTNLVNECGYPIQLRGMSTHGLQWFGNCICDESLNVMVTQWKIDLFRVAIYVQEGGYVKNKDGYKTQVDHWVDECEKHGIYCLIDWHVLNPGNPNDNGYSDASDFWDYMSKKHGSKKHVLYEICNEPNGGVQWSGDSGVKSYAEKMLKIIRDTNKDETVVIVGTPTWSQDVDDAANDPLKQSNVMYTLHFYAGDPDHQDRLRNKANTAISKGLAIFVTEFGTSCASGNGCFDEGKMRTWFKWMNDNNVSFANWSYADKGETSAALQEGSCGQQKWNNTTDSGTLIKTLISESRKAYTNCDGQTETPGGEQGGDQGGGEQGGDQPGGEQGGDQPGGQQGGQQTTPAECPTIVSSIASKDTYRIVNKNSCRVLSTSGVTGQDAIKQATRNEQDKSQQFVIKEENGYYIIENVASGQVFANRYSPNMGDVISQEDYRSDYDNPTQKWKFTAVNGGWYRIENKNIQFDHCLEISNGSTDEGASLIQNNFNNQDYQLWGFEKVATSTDVMDANSNSLRLVPTIVENEFTILGDDYTSVSVFSTLGVQMSEFEKQEAYDIAHYTKGAYIVVLFKEGVASQRFTILKK